MMTAATVATGRRSGQETRGARVEAAKEAARRPPAAPGLHATRQGRLASVAEGPRTPNLFAGRHDIPVHLIALRAQMPELFTA